MLANGKKLKLPRARIRARGRPQTPLSLSPSKLLIQGLPRHKLRVLVFVVYLFFMFIIFVSSFFFFIKEMYHTFAINEDMFLLLNLNLNSMYLNSMYHLNLMPSSFNLNSMYCYIRQTEHIIS